MMGSSRARALPAVLLAAPLLGGCFDIDSVDPPEQHAWEVDVQSPIDGDVPFFHGTVAMLTGSQSTDVTIHFDEATPGQEYGWSIRAGSCDDPGDPVAPDEVFEDFAIGEDGQGGAQHYGIAGQVREDLEYVTHIYEVEEEDRTLLLCRTLEPFV